MAGSRASLNVWFERFERNLNRRLYFFDNQLSLAQLSLPLYKWVKRVQKNTKNVRQIKIGDLVLGTLDGYPPWPAMVSAKSR